MTPGTSPSVVAVPAPLILTASGLPRVVGAAPNAGSTSHRLGWLLLALGDIVGVLAVVYCLPLVILGVGIPVALLVRLLGWLTRTF